MVSQTECDIFKTNMVNRLNIYLKTGCFSLAGSVALGFSRWLG